jgi:thioredoxin reductase (NADPH)
VVHDSIIVGAGPGGLQAAIYLGRFNFSVLVLDRTGGRTRHARHVENYLGHRQISGPGFLDIGVEQARSFGVAFETAEVSRISKERDFLVETGEGGRYEARTVIVSSGVRDRLPAIEHLHRFLGRGFYTCDTCDGYLTVGKKLLVMGNHINSVRLAFGMKRMYTPDVSLLLLVYEPPDDYKDLLKEEGISLLKGRPKRIIGEEQVEGLELEDGTRIACEAIMSNFGVTLNDGFLSGLDLKRDARGFKYRVNNHFESSLEGLYIVGPLNTGHDQIVIAAGEGAAAALDVKRRILEL